MLGFNKFLVHTELFMLDEYVVLFETEEGGGTQEDLSLIHIFMVGEGHEQ